jgi:hypothetical protein
MRRALSLARACQHATNYTADHESHVPRVGGARLAFSADHIAWLLGRLEARFGREACYVHLRRDRDACAKSHNRRWEKRGMMMAYARGILNRRREHGFNIDVCYDYLDTIEANINLFLRGKPHQMELWLETLGISEQLEQRKTTQPPSSPGPEKTKGYVWRSLARLASWRLFRSPWIKGSQLSGSGSALKTILMPRSPS